MNRRKIHILYEHGVDKRPFGSASIRLLRPLTHPSLQHKIQVTSGLMYGGQDVDAIIVDRLWRPDISPASAEALLENIHARDVRLIYALDDSFLDLPAEKKDWDPTEDRLQVVRLFLSQADGILVTTQALREKFINFNSNIAVVSHALDERLLPAWRSSEGKNLSLKEKLDKYIVSLLYKRTSPLYFTRPKPKVIGYMGTLTHDDDLMMVLPALRAVWQRHLEEIEFQIVGVVGRPDTRQALKGLPVRILKPSPKKAEYSRFMSWFSRCLDWDIAIAPLQDTPFNRCKSDVKFLDYSALGTAGIYSRVPAYETSVRHKQTGWLAENKVEAWIEALEELLADNHLRRQLAQNATHYLFTQRTLACGAHNWLEAIDTLLDNR
jgi:glycosyltransferase involved in cell wall biosynthesis